MKKVEGSKAQTLAKDLITELSDKIQLVAKQEAEPGAFYLEALIGSFVRIATRLSGIYTKAQISEMLNEGYFLIDEVIESDKKDSTSH
jgi:hypothetical protein